MHCALKGLFVISNYSLSETNIPLLQSLCARVLMCFLKPRVLVEFVLFLHGCALESEQSLRFSASLVLMQCASFYFIYFPLGLSGSR